MRRTFPTFWLSLLMLLPDLSGATETLRFGTFKNTDSPALQVCEQVIREAYARLGRRIEVEHLPAERSLYWAQSGRLDGDLCRGQQSDDLLQVPTALYQLQLTAFSTRALPVSSWADLKPYKIAYERGMRSIQEHQELDLVAVNSIHSGILLLQNNRVDILLYDHYSVLYAANKMNLSQPLVGQPIVLGIPARHLLNKKHKALIEPLNQALQEMEKSGRIQQIEEHVMARFMLDDAHRKQLEANAVEP